jgi:putative glutamine amidotransferase
MREGYVNGVIEAGGTPLLIPPQVTQLMLRQIYELVDGILLPGGADIDPVHYGQEHHPKLGQIEPLRDAIELPIARWAVVERKPLLAVCRGMQVLNVALGGTLYQDINSQLPTTIEHDAGSAQKCWTNFDHDVALEPSSRLAELLGSDHFQANSLHHQALEQIASGLRVTGRAPDGVIEAVEGEGDAFVLGVQCHPEQLWHAVDTRWQRVFQAFVAAAAEQKAQRTVG